jgi:hypothetical protein
MKSMMLTDRFTFGQYKKLQLVDVYQGISEIDLMLFSAFITHCLQNVLVPKPQFFESAEIQITGCLLEIEPHIFNEELPYSKENSMILSDSNNKFGLSSQLEQYFNEFFRPTWLGIVTTLAKFNTENEYYQTIGGDPEYIEWCMRNNKISIDLEVLHRLQDLKVNRLLGVKINRINEFQYEIKPNIAVQKFRFLSIL